MLVIDLNPYGDLSTKLVKELAELRKIKEKFTGRYSNNDKYLGLLDFLEQETSIIAYQWKKMHNYLRGIELLQTRPKRAVLPIVGKALSVLFGTVSESDMKTIRRKLKDVEEGQKVLAQVAKESVSILNVTRVELAKNRGTIDWLVGSMETLQEEVGNVTDGLIELDNFVQQYFQLMAIITRVRQTSRTLITLLEHVRAQLDMLSLGHLSPSIVTPSHLRSILVGIRARLPHHLRLPVDPTKELWMYYNALGCVTLLEDDKLLVLLSVPLLDRDSIFEIYRVMNLPLPYPREDQKLGAVARYKIETEFLALNLARTKFMLLSEVEAIKCKNDALGTCSSVSPIYVMGNHELCVLELYKGDRGGIDKNCQTEVLTNIVLPQAISVTDGIWALATQTEFALSEVCEGKPTKTVKVIPPLAMIKLPLGCSAFGTSVSLPPYYQAVEKFEETESISDLLGTNISDWAELWKPLVEGAPEATLRKIPKLLGPVERIDLDQLQDKLSSVGTSNSVLKGTSGIVINWSVMIGILLIIVMILSAVFLLKRRRKILSRERALAGACESREGDPLSVSEEGRGNSNKPAPRFDKKKETAPTKNSPKTLDEGLKDAVKAKACC